MIFLEAHDNGRKYLGTAKELSELMEGRMSCGRHVPVLTIEKPIAIQKGQQGADGKICWRNRDPKKKQHGKSPKRSIQKQDYLASRDSLDILGQGSGLHGFFFQLS